MQLTGKWVGLIATLVSMPLQAANVPFADADFSAYAGEGTATLEGEAFLRLQSGNIKNCAGAAVLLVPATEYDLAIIKSITFSMDRALKKAGPAARYWREAQCDSQGRFSFEDLPVGEWIVLTDVTFAVVDQNRVLGNLTSGGGLAGKGVTGVNQASTVEKGGIMGRRVTVTTKHNKIILNEQSLRAGHLFDSGWPK